MPSDITDRELLYARLLDRYHAHIVAFCARHSDSRDEASDLMQWVLLAVWESVGSLRRDSSPRQVNRWLQKVMLSTYVRHLRGRPRYKAVPLDVTNEPPADDGALTETVEELLSHLSPDDRNMVQQRLKGYDNSEIAQQLGLTANNVNQHFFRITNRLKKIYIQIYGK